MADTVMEPLLVAVTVLHGRAAAAVQLTVAIPRTGPVGGFDGRAVVTMSLAVYPPLAALIGGNEGRPVFAV